MKTNNDLTQLKQALHQHTHGFCWCTCVSTCKHEQIGRASCRERVSQRV